MFKNLLVMLKCFLHENYYIEEYTMWKIASANYWYIKNWDLHISYSKSCPMQNETEDPFWPFKLKASIDNTNSSALDSFISPRLEAGLKLAQCTEI